MKKYKLIHKIIGIIIGTSLSIFIVVGSVLLAAWAIKKLIGLF